MDVKIKKAVPDGILLIDKEGGRTSFDAVRMIRKVLKIKKVGHAGTLDPFATGLLIILVGQGTKLSPYIMGGKKKYRAVIRLGIETDTCDPTGSVIKEAPVPDAGIEIIKEVTDRFTGLIEQVPPAYSALKVNGERAYKLARKGIEVELKKREVTVYSIDIVDISLPLVTIDVSCSAGTYIRSLAVDIGKKLGTVAHLKKLRRVSSGLFYADGAVAFAELEHIKAETLANSIIPLHESLPEMTTVKLDNQLAGKVRNGYRPSWKELTRDLKIKGKNSGYVKLTDGSGLVAVLEIERTSNPEHNRLKKVKVFNN